MENEKSGLRLPGALNTVSAPAVPGTALGRESLRGLAHAYYFSCALHAVVNLELADRLATGPESVERLAEQLGDRVPDQVVYLPALNLRYERFSKFNLSHFDRDMNVQVRSAVALFKRLLPKMAELNLEKRS